MEREALVLDTQAAAMAAQQRQRPRDRAGRAHRARRARSTRARSSFPGVLVDCVVVAAAEAHQQTYAHRLQRRVLRRAAGACGPHGAGCRSTSAS